MLVILSNGQLIPHIYLFLQMIIGTDVADLLLEGHEPSTASLCKQGLSIRTTMCDSMVETSVEGVDRSLINPQQQLDDVTDRFRHLLLRGRKKVRWVDCYMKTTVKPLV